MQINFTVDLDDLTISDESIESQIQDAVRREVAKSVLNAYNASRRIESLSCEAVNRALDTPEFKELLAKQVEDAMKGQLGRTDSYIRERLLRVADNHIVEAIKHIKVTAEEAARHCMAAVVNQK